jgi:hypothetical protein
VCYDEKKELIPIKELAPNLLISMSLINIEEEQLRNERNFNGGAAGIEKFSPAIFHENISVPTRHIPNKYPQHGAYCKTALD